MVWSGGLQSIDTLIVTLVVIAVVGYIAASGCSLAAANKSTKNRRNRPVPFARIVQDNKACFKKSGKVCLSLLHCMQIYTMPELLTAI